MMISGVRSAVSQMMDDWCGTKPKPFPFPPKLPQLSGFARLADKVALNPQPLPPKALQLFDRARLADKVALNPQPLPPKAAFDEFRGTVLKQFSRPLPDLPPLNLLSFQFKLR